MKAQRRWRQPRGSPTWHFCIIAMEPFLIQRKKQAGGLTPLYDMALSFAASADDPISGGRHKVLGCAQTFVPPQTSTIASHLPKAVGAAHSIGMAQRLKLDDAVLPYDAVILCSFRGCFGEPFNIARRVQCRLLGCLPEFAYADRLSLRG